MVTDDNITKRTVELGIAIGELINKTMIAVNMEGNETHVAEFYPLHVFACSSSVFATVKPSSKNFPLIPASFGKNGSLNSGFTTLNRIG